MTRSSALPLLTLSLLASHVSGQDFRWSNTGPYSTQAYGRTSSSLADVNGDGFRDILIGDPAAQPFGGVSGEVHLVSGQDGSNLYTIVGPNTSARIGQDVLGIQDVTGDGVEDFIITSDTDFPEVRSGASGAFVRSLPIVSLQGDHVVESLGDIDGDGLNELVFGDQRALSNRGRVSVVRGSFVATGGGSSFLWSRDGLEVNGVLGTDVANAGDVNGDGVNDVVAGAPAETGPNGELGILYLLSGIDGSVIHNITHSSAVTGLGIDVDTAGDWDGDGFADVVAGLSLDQTGGVSAGAITIYSGLTGGILHTVFGTSNDRYGISVLGGIDVDGDGREEVLFGAFADPCTTGRGTVRALDPVTGSVDFLLCGPSDAFLYGEVLQAAGDVDGDGQQDFLVTDPENVPNIQAKIFLYGGRCVGSVTRYCPPTLNSSGHGAAMSASGSLSISDNSLALLARSCPPNEFGLFYYGRDQIMAFVGDGWRCAGGPTFRLRPVVQIDGSGVAQRVLDFTVAPLGSGPGTVLPGSNWNFQFWFRDPMGAGGNFNYSDALSITFCP